MRHHPDFLAFFVNDFLSTSTRFLCQIQPPAFYCQSVERLPAIRQVVLHSLPPFDTMCPHIHQKKTTCFKKDMLIKTRIQDTNFTLIHPTKSGEKFFCQFCLYVCRPDFAVTINFIGDQTSRSPALCSESNNGPIEITFYRARCQLSQYGEPQKENE